MIINADDLVGSGLTEGVRCCCTGILKRVKIYWFILFDAEVH